MMMMMLVVHCRLWNSTLDHAQVVVDEYKKDRCQWRGLPVVTCAQRARHTTRIGITAYKQYHLERLPQLATKDYSLAPGLVVVKRHDTSLPARRGPFEQMWPWKKAMMIVAMMIPVKFWILSANRLNRARRKRAMAVLLQLHSRKSQRDLKSHRKMMMTGMDDVVVQSLWLM